jgi:hypothetical protein
MGPILKKQRQLFSWYILLTQWPTTVESVQSHCDQAKHVLQCTLFFPCKPLVECFSPSGFKMLVEETVTLGWWPNA